MKKITLIAQEIDQSFYSFLIVHDSQQTNASLLLRTLKNGLTNFLFCRFQYEIHDQQISNRSHHVKSTNMAAASR